VQERWELPIPQSPPLTGADASVLTFSQFDLSAALVDVLEHRGIRVPLPIQEAALADALAGRDVCGKAPTGSGKTLAFALPMAARLERGRPGRPRGLVLAPTRELAAQIAAELTPLARTRRLRVHAFYGGVGFGDQLRALRQGVDIAVACPGRLGDLMHSRHVDLADVDMVVVDEADRMADMGFLPEVQRILDTTSPARQTLLFSATLDGAVDVLVRRYQRDPVRHEVDAGESDIGRMTHRFHGVNQADRAALCAELVTAEGASLVFVRTRHGADRLTRQLERSGVSAAAIHGDRSQAQRDRALAAFRGGKVRALVATDVAARGIHVDDVDCVIHYDPPPDPKDYVHRSGRTARAGASGTVVTLVMPEQRKAVEALWRALELDPELVGMGSSNGSGRNQTGSQSQGRGPSQRPAHQRARRPRPQGAPHGQRPKGAAKRNRRAGGARPARDPR
jgi:superfamily II DNA/RNA helicase